MKKCFQGCLMPALLLLGLAGQILRAADGTTALPTLGSGSLSATASPSQRAPWQQRLTLGPGDVLNFALFVNDEATQSRNNVVIGPDGRVSYLQAQDILASGLTVDELRAKFDSVLTNLYRLPRTIITPVAIYSKKYFVLGAVVNRGVFTFNRPVTIIEAIASAGGLATGVLDRNAVELADLAHSFLVRGGQRVPLDFEKLFQQGELSQNITLEPNDYLFFASASDNEVYILGAVLQPGPMAFAANIGAVGAIASRGGFAPKGYKSRVLVIRGSLASPQTFVVNTLDVLGGKAPDFRLQSKDIVYVSERPWAKAETLLDEGARAFISAVIVTYTGDKLGPFIDPIIR